MPTLDPDMLFRAMADKSRRRILQVLIANELTVSEVVEIVQLPQSTVSRHLKSLRGAGLVDARHEGTTAHYFAIAPGTGSEDLPARVLSWTASQPLPSRLSARMAQVLARRAGTGGFFGRIAHHWDTLRADCFGRAFQHEALAALLPSDWVVADVGTGTGSLLPLLSATFSRVIAVDSVGQMVAAASERVRQLDLTNVALLEGSATRLPVDEASLDLVIASLILHHEEEPAAALAEFRRVLVPGGRLLIIEQGAHELQAFHELMQDRWWGFEQEELAARATEAGFSGVRWRHLASAEPENTSAPEAPELFVLTAQK